MSERVCLGKEDETGRSVRCDNNAVEQEIVPKKEINDDGDLVNLPLSDNKCMHNKCVQVHKYRNATMVSISEFYEKDGRQVPTITEVNMSPKSWATFKSNIPAIEEAILQLKGKTRSEHDAEKIGGVSEPATRVTPPKFPIGPVRFDGKNYIVWGRQMEFLLQQLKIAYVLLDQCPTDVLGLESSSGNDAQSQTAEQKWMNDDYMCRRLILGALSDRFFNEYTKKTMSATELWTELKLLYFREEFGDKRSQVKKYLEFNIDEEKTTLEQLEELNNIADSIDSIVSAGMSMI